MTRKRNDNIKALTGSARPDRASGTVVPFRRLDSAPEPPDWLADAHAIREWRRLAPMLCAVGVLTEASLTPLAHLCALHGKLVSWWSEPDNPPPPAALVGNYRSLSGEFGLTPASQSKIPAGGKQEGKGNRFAHNGKRA